MNEPRSRRKIFYGWWVLLLAALVTFSTVGSSGWTYTVLVSPMSRELGWSHTQILGALSLAYLLSGLSAPWIGRASDKYGPRIVLTIGTISLGLMLALTRQMTALWQFYFLYGVGRGLTSPAAGGLATQVIVAKWFIQKRGIAFGVLNAGMSISGILFVPGAQVIADLWGWRTVWFVMGLALIFAITPLIWLVVRNRPEDMGLHPDGKEILPHKPMYVPSSQDNQRSLKQVAEISWTLKEASKTRTFWLLNLSLLVTFMPIGTMYAIMHSHFTEEGVSTTTAATLVGFWSFALLIGTPIWAYLVQRFGVSRLLFPAAIFLGGTIAVYVVVGTSSIALIYLTLLPMGIGTTGLMQLAQQVWPDYYGTEHLGAILGFNNLLKVSSTAGGPLVAAVLHDATGSYTAAFAVFAATGFIAALGLLFVRPPRKSVPT